MAIKAIITGLVIAGVGVLVLSAPNGKNATANPQSSGQPAAVTAATGDSDCSACSIQPSATAKAAMATDECCASAAGGQVVKGEQGCCNAPTELAKFAVIADGKPHYYGCEDSAKQGRTDLVKAGATSVGEVTTVTEKVSISGKKV